MRQKFLYLCFLIVISCMFGKAYAQTIEVTALESFSTAEPPKAITIKLNQQLELPESNVLDAGSVLKGDLVDIVSPKRLKRDAGFSFKPVSYTDLEGQIHNLELNIIASYTTTLDKAGLAKTAALGVGNYFVKGLSMGVAAVSGAVKNDEGNRLKSSAVSVYDSSPFSYVEKGEDLYIEPDQVFLLKFPDADKIKTQEVVQDDEVKGQNYSYTIEKE